MASEAVKLASKIFGSKTIKKLTGSSRTFENKFKIVVFVPLENTDEVTFAMASAGAGTIGNYTVCSFRMKGAGTFMGNEKSNPVIGGKGKFEMTEEIRLEMICDKKNLQNAVERMYDAHPYDEPAFEVYEVLTGTKKQSGKYLKIPLDKKIKIKSLLKKINPLIDSENLPVNFKGITLKECVIDLRDNIKPAHLKNTLYITGTNNKIKAYIA